MEQIPRAQGRRAGQLRSRRWLRHSSASEIEQVRAAASAGSDRRAILGNALPARATIGRLLPRARRGVPRPPPRSSTSRRPGALAAARRPDRRASCPSPRGDSAPRRRRRPVAGARPAGEDDVGLAGWAMRTAGSAASPRASAAARALRARRQLEPQPVGQIGLHLRRENRCLETRCPARLRRSSSSQARPGSKRITASTPSRPFLVPPKLSASTPAFQDSSAGVQPSAPARWRSAPRPCAPARPPPAPAPASAATSSGP